jgi:Spy/CpxP family protein refolding chaperone
MRDSLVRSLVLDEKADLSVIEAKVKERGALEAKLRFMGIKAKRDLFAVLTPEQRDKLKAIRDHWRRGSASAGLAQGQDDHPR